MQEMPKRTRSLIKIDLRKMAVFAAIIAATVLIDQLTKMAVVSNMTLGQSIPLIKDFLHITYILNEGAAFGMLADHRWIFLILSTASIVLIAVGVLLFSGKIGWGYGISFSMIVGGGIGNMIDRLFNGEVMGSGAVIDFIDFRGIWSYIFNGADSFVCVGVALFMLFVIIEEVKEVKNKRAKSATAPEKTDVPHDGETHE